MWCRGCWWRCHGWDAIHTGHGIRILHRTRSDRITSSICVSRVTVFLPGAAEACIDPSLVILVFGKAPSKRKNTRFLYRTTSPCGCTMDFFATLAPSKVLGATDAIWSSVRMLSISRFMRSWTSLLVYVLVIFIATRPKLRPISGVPVRVLNGLVAAALVLLVLDMVRIRSIFPAMCISNAETVLSPEVSCSAGFVIFMENRLKTEFFMRFSVF